MKASRHSHRHILRSIVVLVTLTGLWALAAIPAHAQAEQPSPTPTPQPPFVTETTPVMSAADLWPFAAALLAVTVLGWLFLYVYVFGIQVRYYQVFEGLALRGRAPRVRLASSVVLPGDRERGEAPAQKELEVEGPGAVAVGVQSAEYTAKLDGNPATGASWSVDPSSAATLSSTTGASVKLTPKSVGAFTLTAKVDGSSATFPVVAVAGQADPGEMPFAGTGFGSIVIAILLVTAVVLLALRGVLSGEMVATFFGALVGYVFGVRTAGGTDSRRRTGQQNNTQGEGSS